MLDSIQFERIFLAMMGWELPIHDPARMKLFDKEARILGAGDVELRLDRAKAARLITSPIPEIVVSILHDCLRSERLASSKMNAKHEIATTEEWVSRFIERMMKSMDKDLLSVQEDHAAPANLELPKPAQQSLCLVVESEGVNPRSRSEPFAELHFVMPKIPAGIHQVRCGNSTTGPLIFWALVAARFNGEARVSGTKITKVINDHLVDDKQHLHATNVSKALRGPVLREQRWLVVFDDSRGGHPLFGLSDSWKPEWRELFGEPPPGDST